MRSEVRSDVLNSLYDGAEQPEGATSKIASQRLKQYQTPLGPDAPASPTQVQLLSHSHFGWSAIVVLCMLRRFYSAEQPDLAASDANPKDCGQRHLAASDTLRPVTNANRLCECPAITTVVKGRLRTHDNHAPELLAKSDIDGALVGGASLQLEDFKSIILSAQN